jgi:formamidopyrimidine-DNA glycosylase
MDRRGFTEALSDRRESVKSALMDQQLLAGVGNVYSDEILFHARLDPRTRVDTLTEGDRRRLHRELQTVLEGAIRHGADPSRVPSSWLVPHRARGGRCPRCGTKLKRIKVGGRTAWLRPSCQERR